MSAESCETCRFWLAPEPDTKPETTAMEYPDIQGRCRRRSPHPEKWITTRMNWPRSDAGDWCGEYEQQPIVLGPIRFREMV